MTEKDISCPCCNASLTVNLENGNIIHFSPYKKGPAEFSDFVNSQKNRKDAIAKKFEDSKLKSQTRMKEIEEKIAWTQKRMQDQ